MESPQRKLPEDPLAFIQACVQQRSIACQAMLDVVGTYEIIEAYPGDKYFPSYLVLAKHYEEVLHIVFATDVEGDNVRIVTAYHPSPDEWESDGRTRRTP